MAREQRVLELLECDDERRLVVWRELKPDARGSLLQGLSEVLEDTGASGIVTSRLKCEAIEALEGATLAGWCDEKFFEEQLAPCLTRSTQAPEVVALAAEKSGGWGFDAFTPNLMRLLDDHQDARVRFWCIYALGNMRAMEAIESLRRAREDVREVQGWWSVREEADYMLRQLLGVWPHPTPRADEFLGP